MQSLLWVRERGWWSPGTRWTLQWQPTVGRPRPQRWWPPRRRWHCARAGTPWPRGSGHHWSGMTAGPIPWLWVPRIHRTSHAATASVRAMYLHGGAHVAAKAVLCLFTTRSTAVTVHAIATIDDEPVECRYRASAPTPDNVRTRSRTARSVLTPKAALSRNISPLPHGHLPTRAAIIPNDFCGMALLNVQVIVTTSETAPTHRLDV